jgi:hypothetical protein
MSMYSEATRPLEGFTFGCDPELFVLDQNGTPVSAAGLIPGSKMEPHKVEDGAIQVDGMAAEFNIDPVSTFEDFDKKITSVIKQLKTYLPKGYKLLPVPSITFSEDVWLNSSDEAKELGCTPDYNAWTGKVNPPPRDPENPRMRTASGHLHVGWTDNATLSDAIHVENCRDLVKQFDWYLGAWSTTMDNDTNRRRLYGKAGACRYKPYGVEYRVLSNFWLTSKKNRFMVWERMQRAIHDMSRDFMPDTVNSGIAKKYQFNDRLVKSINSGVLDHDLTRFYRFPLVGEI